MLKPTVLALAALLVACEGPAAQAAPLHQTFYVREAPRMDEIAGWSALPGSRSYLFHLDDPTSADLEPIASLRGADRIQVQVGTFPNVDTAATWKQLASQGVGFVSYRAGYPTEGEIDRLNAAGVSRVTFVTEGYPDPSDAARLGRLAAQVSLTFASRAYPRFVDKPGLQAIPSGIPLLFSADYWPWYTHMDILNLLPHSKKLRVTGGSMPTEDALPYLRNIERLQDVAVETDFEPSREEWLKFQGLPLTWSSRGPVPSRASLAAFIGDGRAPRRLIVDSDLPLSEDERSRLEASPIPVEWIHAPLDGAPSGAHR